MKTGFLFLCAIWLTFLFSCGEGNVVTAIDPSVQRAEDVAIIEAYLSEKGYSESQIDTTESGVRYVILDVGNTDTTQIDESDIVDFNYIGRLTDDALFDTSIEAVALEDDDIYSENREYEPLRINYTSSGWTIETRFVNGFTDGISATFNGLHIGGHTLIVIPSDLGYGAFPQFSGDTETIPPNSVLTFELFPVGIVKQ